MNVRLHEIKTRGDLKKFIHLPGKIHRDHKNWVPPVYSDEWSFYNPKKNRSFQHCSTLMLLAYRDERLAGRIMGIINHKYNEFHHQKKARIFAFECYDDEDIAIALTSSVESWARKTGMEMIIGPFGFSDKDPQGFMLEGFDEPMIIATNCNLPYMNDLIEKCGFNKEIDLLEYRLPVPRNIPHFYKAIHDRSAQINRFTLIEFSRRRELKPYIWPVFDLINTTYGNIYGFIEMTPNEVNYMVSRYFHVINPKFVKVVLDKQEKIAAFALAMPEISDGIRSAGGRLLPFGVIKIMKAARQTRMLTMLLGAIRKDFRNNGLDVLLGMKIIESASELNYKYIDSHLVLETNVKMLAEYRKLGGEICKRYRIYGKQL